MLPQRIQYLQLRSRSYVDGWPGITDKTESLRNLLHKGLKTHYEHLAELAPNIVGHPMVPTTPGSDPILLPSSFTSEQCAAFGIQHLVDIEKELRMGNGHDCVKGLCEALGVRSFLTRHAAALYNYKENKAAQQSMRRSEANVKLWRAIYVRTWRALGRLGVEGSSLRGLQELKESDVVLLSDWLESSRYRSKSTQDRLPWIWTVSPLLQPKQNGTDSEHDEVEKWNEEGNVLIAKIPPVHD